MRFAANLSTLFVELPFLDRFAAARRAGFDAVECQLPYAFTIDEIRQRLVDNGLTMVLHNLPAGDWAAGERGIACHPDRVAEFEAGVDRGLEYAGALGCTRLNCLAGIVPPDVDEADARATFIRNLRYAAPRARAAGVELLIEPINTKDVPGFFLSQTRQAAEIIAAADAGHLFIQFDAYHMHIMEGRLVDTISRRLPMIRHVQIADAPGRHEPGTGEIDFANIFAALDQGGYAGWIGCEYNPKSRTEDGLAWIARLRA